MITYVVSNLLQSPARVLVNTVNIDGVMGKGIAKDFKSIYPEMFKEYQSLCERKLFNIGQLWLYKTQYKWILNFPTKEHWRSPSKLKYLELGLKKFSETYAEKGITSISCPLLGCGNGGLDWEQEVKPLMEKYLERLPIDVFIHLYHKDPFEPEHLNINEIKEWLRSKPESLPFSEVWDDICNLLSSKEQFNTVNKSQSFIARITNTPDTGINIIINNDMKYIHEEQLLDLWQHLRGFGFCMDRTLPSGLENDAPFIFSVLSELPYLRPVLLGNKYNNMKKLEIGLQFVPRSDHTKSGLLQPPPMKVARL